MKKQKNIIWLVLAVAFFVTIFSQTNVASAATCPLSGTGDDYYRNGSITVSFAKINSTQAQTTVTNNNSCDFPASVVSYKMFDNQTVLTQVNLDNTGVVIIPAHSAHTFNINLAPCLTQVDAYYSQGPLVFTDGDPARARLVKGIIFGPDGRTFNRIPEAQGTFCSVPPPPTPDPTLNGSCSGNPNSVNLGSPIVWSATASGGTGAYTYAWSGTENLTGSGSSVSQTCSYSGTKNASVTITSGTQSVVKTCNAVVNQEIINNDLAVSCNANKSTLDIDEDITWRAYPTGGNGSYSYIWTGTNSLSGNSQNIIWNYDTAGTKRAYVTVSSNGQSVSASCTTRVEEDYSYEDDLTVSCYANPSNPQIGERMNWYVRVSGGDGDYNYDWTGTEGLNSSSRSPYMTYNNPGSKRATVTVEDGNGNEDTANCYANVENNNVVLSYNQTYIPPMVAAVSLSQVPYTGVADNFASIGFASFLALISAWIAYIIIERKKEVGEFN